MGVGSAVTTSHPLMRAPLLAASARSARSSHALAFMPLQRYSSPSLRGDDHLYSPECPKWRGGEGETGEGRR